MPDPSMPIGPWTFTPAPAPYTGPSVFQPPAPGAALQTTRVPTPGPPAAVAAGGFAPIVGVIAAAALGGLIDYLVPGGAIGPTGGVAAPSSVALGTATGVVNGVVTRGPGVPEPDPSLVAKHWRWAVTAPYDVGTYYCYAWRLHDGRIMTYNPRKTEWKIWRPKKNIVISADPRVSTIKKLTRTYLKVTKRLAKKSPHLKYTP